MSIFSDFAAEKYLRLSERKADFSAENADNILGRRQGTKERHYGLLTESLQMKEQYVTDKNAKELFQKWGELLHIKKFLFKYRFYGIIWLQLKKAAAVHCQSGMGKIPFQLCALNGVL